MLHDRASSPRRVRVVRKGRGRLWNPQLDIARGLLAALVLAGIAAVVTWSFFSHYGWSGASGCNIKGIGMLTGARIYHVPGQQYYEDTRINPLKGERWFCSEAKAQAAGWRRSRV